MANPPGSPQGSNKPPPKKAGTSTIAGTDTGTGGFNIDDKAYTYDVDDLGTAGAEPDHAYSTGDIDVDETPKDISRHTKITLADYLSDLTQGNKPGGTGPVGSNDYPIDNDSEQIDDSPRSISLSDETGNPAALAPSPNKAQFGLEPRFEDARLPTGLGLPSLQDDPAVDVGYKKWGEDVSGDDVLTTVKSTDSPDKPDVGGVADYTSKVLANNRFVTSTRQGNRPLRIPNRADGNTLGTSQGPTHDLSQMQLANVGLALSIRASQELNAVRLPPSSGDTKALALLPGTNQLALLKAPIIELFASDVLATNDLSEPIDDKEMFSIYGSLDEGSWGAMNNVYDPYSGIASLGMIPLSIALTAGVVLVYEGLGFLISLIGDGGGPVPSKKDSGAYVLGSYLSQAGLGTPTGGPGDLLTSFPPDIGRLLGIRSTRFPYGSAVKKGTAAFFGIPDDDGIGGAILGGLKSAVETPGFNSIVGRMIIRSGAQVVEAIADIFSSADLMSGIENLLNMIDTLRSSKVIAAMNIFATLGDSVLSSDQMGANVFSGGENGEPLKVSQIDSFDDNASVVSKNRIGGGLKLAWASNRATSLYMLPNQLAGLSLGATALGGLGAYNPIATMDKLSRVYQLTTKVGSITGGRLAQDEVDSIEGSIEGDYMPFYFHDLRTNEIISFHAFLTALSDDFTANWEQSEPYGRVDPVRIYKNTGRKISLGFHIISTSEVDFDDMWFKINKLITLVYPQYTRGRKKMSHDGAYAFTEPFSQLIGASPLVRLRLGDLFKTNYSRFGLARLFGADSGEMQINSGTPLDFGVINKDSLEAFQKLIEKKKAKNQTGWALSVDGLKKPMNASSGPEMPSPPVPGSSNSVNAPDFADSFKLVRPSDIGYFMFKIVDDSSIQVGPPTVGIATVAPIIMSTDEMVKFLGMSSDEAKKTHGILTAEYANPDKPKYRVTGVAGKEDTKNAIFQVPADALTPGPVLMQELIKEQFGDAFTGVEELTKFLDVEENALVRAFHQMGGKGLAGTIDSINFDWYDNVTWETSRIRHKAPMMCKVSMAFTPIHDISPGLDHNGFNRAPVYPVGRLAQGMDPIKKKDSGG